jgi:acetyltransferase
LCSNDLSSEILQSFQIPVLEEVLVRSWDDIDSMWYYLNDVPLVAKIDSPDIAHKSDVWWIVFDITSKKKALDAYHTIMSNIWEYMPEVNIKWIKFAKMIESRDQAKEIFVGFKRDESFWNVLLVWAWWIFVNVYNDVNRRIWIVSKKEIENMLKQLVIYPILKWIRWQKSINFDSLIDTIYKLQYIFLEFEGIKEIDINPIVCDQHGSIIVDTKFYLDN